MPSAEEGLAEQNHDLISETKSVWPVGNSSSERSQLTSPSEKLSSEVKPPSTLVQLSTSRPLNTAHCALQRGVWRGDSTTPDNQGINQSEVAWNEGPGPNQVAGGRVI